MNYTTVGSCTDENMSQMIQIILKRSMQIIAFTRRGF